jgi:hypothetical protein
LSRTARTAPSSSIMTQGKCCGVQAPAAAHEKMGERISGRLKWIGLKLVVVITSGIMAYTAYVYIGRLCVPMIKRSSDAGAGRGTGGECQCFCLFFSNLMLRGLLG